MGDLNILARELQEIAEARRSMRYVDVMAWAEGWFLTLVELGIRPAPREGVSDSLND